MHSRCILYRRLHTDIEPYEFAQLCFEITIVYAYRTDTSEIQQMTLNSSACDRSALSVFERSETPQTCCETTWYIEARRLRGEGTVAKGVNAESESRAEWFASAVRACKRSYVLSCSLTMRMHSQHAHRFGQAGPRVEVHRFHRSPVGRITDSVACSITFTSCAVSCIGML